MRRSLDCGLLSLLGYGLAYVKSQVAVEVFISWGNLGQMLCRTGSKRGLLHPQDVAEQKAKEAGPAVVKLPPCPNFTTLTKLPVVHRGAKLFPVLR